MLIVILADWPPPERRHQLEVITFPAAASMLMHHPGADRKKSLFDLHAFSPNLAVYCDTLAGRLSQQWPYSTGMNKTYENIHPSLAEGTPHHGRWTR